MPSKEYLSGNDALTLLETINLTLNCNSREDFTTLFPRIQALLSCDFAIAVLGHLDAKKDVVVVEGVNISFPEQWCVEYRSNNYVRSDLVVKENFTNYNLQRWSKTKGKVLCHESQKKIASLCLDFGMKDGYTLGSCPLHPEKNGSMFCYSGRSMEYGERTEAVLEYVTPHLHLALSRIMSNGPPNINNTVLSKREKEILNWLKSGKSSWDVSVILGISQNTVNFHVYNIMRKLGAVNRPQAVAVATHMGIIAPG